MIKQGSNVIRIFCCYNVVEVCFSLICVPATHLNLHPAVEIIVCRWPSRKHTHNRSNSKSGFSPSGNSQSQVLTLLLARKVWFVCSLRGKCIILITAGAFCLSICLVSGSGPLWLVWAAKKRVMYSYHFLYHELTFFAAHRRVHLSADLTGAQVGEWVMHPWGRGWRSARGSRTSMPFLNMH